MKKEQEWGAYDQTPETLLIVDDDAINRAILEHIFQEDYKIEQAENGRQGLDMLLAAPERFCAVLLDVMMPQMDGIQVLRELADRHLLEQIPVFLITSEANDATMREAYSLGVMDVIGKPVVPYLVKRRVGSVVELFQARKRLNGVVEQQSSQLFKQAQKIIHLNQGILEALATAIEFRSGESGGHVRRIRDITRLMLSATPLGQGLSAQDVDDIATAAVLHDVGKIAIPDAILNKPGRLTTEEFEVMKTHTLQGAQMLDRISQLRSSQVYAYASDIARHHHERWDGRGYPDGLQGEQITIWSQVVSLADVYDALVSKRVYKGPIGHEESLAMIRGGQCGTFNPELLKWFLALQSEVQAFYMVPGEE